MYIYEYNIYFPVIVRQETNLINEANKGKTKADRERCD